MTAYMVAEIEFIPGEALDQYRKLAADSIAEHGGRFRIRGEAIEAVEGEWPRRLVLVAFPDIEAVRMWYTSPAYQAALAYAPKAMRRRLAFIDSDAD